MSMPKTFIKDVTDDELGEDDKDKRVRLKVHINIESQLLHNVRVVTAVLKVDEVKSCRL